MTGPIRCRKQRPAGSVSPTPPPVVDLPPTPADFSAPPELLVVAARFAEGDFRGCVEPIEALFFQRRNTLHQGLLQYVVGLLQARAGRTITAKVLLDRALELWCPYPGWQDGIDLTALRRHVEVVRAHLLPEGIPDPDGKTWRPLPVLCSERSDWAQRNRR